ncbi:DUF2690 domain-containing protein [Streptomyces sp. NPDC019826]|uniref:DUF2690 domain-containing protein n=1 Tax=Streptomyces TaxID=1883 RepID=UPI0029BA9938|nr:MULTISPECIES: DUF2690 domain-containing protein [unclassified Streptomyces]MDX2623614.1 DUF2690 domain-containing protein [Streptomyces sp. WI03-5b]MEE1774970.1 DUF2690 domain-containing protein [Streptomyces sp. JV181]
MGQPDQVNAGAQLSAMLRQWWQSEVPVRKQGSVVTQLKVRGIETTQPTLSRYLDPATPQIARQEVVRALHAIFARPPEELSAALALWERAISEREADNRLRTTPRTGPAPSACTTAAAPAASEGRAAGSGPRGVGYALVAAAVLLVAAGTLWLTTPWESTYAFDEGVSATAQPSGPAASQTPGKLGVCKDEACIGLEPNYTVCRTDAVTAFVDADTEILVELRYSPKCRAAWAKIKGTSPGDVAQIRDLTGRTRKHTQISGSDAHTTMLPASRPQDVTACAVLAARTVCATISTNART